MHCYWGLQGERLVEVSDCVDENVHWCCWGSQGERLIEMSCFANVIVNEHEMNVNELGCGHGMNVYDHWNVGGYGSHVSLSAHSSARLLLRELEELHPRQGNKLAVMVQGEVVYACTNEDVDDAAAMVIDAPGGWACPCTPRSALLKTA